ncbi:unnamed protein product [Rangifer tarandus platyrhynchus]|uniref:Uncharacterized protein n=2 Tax=Rangifer tarandus platyrhynchus TaxID=3082113 RepID=A0AC59Z4Q5_RANTA|nr:unnamed protein product [Rangifer tarandus platyrhynchus]
MCPGLWGRDPSGRVAAQLGEPFPRRVAQPRGRQGAPVASSPQPLLGFRVPDQPFSDVPRVQDAFRVLRNEPSCPALFCPAGSLCWGSSRDLLLEALLGETQGRPL